MEVLRGRQLNDDNCQKKLIQPHMTAVKTKACKVLLLNSSPVSNNLDEVFKELTHLCIVVGKTGTGKTSFLDTITNIFFGVRFDDDFRYTLKSETELRANQVHSQTKNVVVYIMKNDEMHLGIIDTPGFRDTDSRTIDTGIPNMIRSLLTEAGNPNMNGICYILKNTENRLGPSEKKLIRDIFGLFPKTVISSTFPCFTYCNTPTPEEDASNAFKIAVHGNGRAPKYPEFTFDSGQMMYGTRPKDKTDGKTYRRAEEDYDQNIDSGEKLFQAVRETSFKSEEISNMIKLHQQVQDDVSQMKAFVEATCRGISNLLSEKESKAKEVNDQKEKASEWEKEENSRYEHELEQYQRRELERLKIRERRKERKRAEKQQKRLQKEHQKLKIQHENEMANIRREMVRRNRQEVFDRNVAPALAALTVGAASLITRGNSGAVSFSDEETSDHFFNLSEEESEEEEPARSSGVVGAVAATALTGLFGAMAAAALDPEISLSGGEAKGISSSSSDEEVGESEEELEEEPRPKRRTCPFTSADKIEQLKEIAGKIDDTLKNAKSALSKQVKQLDNHISLTKDTWVESEISLESAKRELHAIVMKECCSNSAAYRDCKGVIDDSF